eukprot:TRINITY_DN5006_c0_g3_i1.p2 TRINITY_DN5006_c0_g3~~TRINITY_DN5006_c0_g3_i1.p2  ORF type:complete len:173 (-),score=24.06 TRINITY_DN5006_c0_g3_i1:41-535(-)
MGIDINNKHRKKGHRTEPKSNNPYLKLLVRLYRFLARRTDSRFNETILHRLCMSRTSRPAISVSKAARWLKHKDVDKTILVSVSPVVDDERLLDVPKMNICALKFTESARARILKAGGKVFTFDQLALLRPTGANCLLVRGPRNAREAFKHFRGIHGKHAKPYE